MQYLKWPKFHAVVFHRLKSSGTEIIPVVYFQTDTGIKMCGAALEYLTAHNGKSDSWKRSACRAIGYFYDYCRATFETHYKRQGNIHYNVLRGFTTALLNGTINVKDGTDESGLYWPPSSLATVRVMCSAINLYVDWCYKAGFSLEHNQADMGPTADEKATLSFLYKAIKIKQLSFLGYLQPTDSLAKELQAKSKFQSTFMPASILSPWNERGSDEAHFPAELVGPLFEYGFLLDEPDKLTGARHDLTTYMICSLLFFAGMRKSEPMHLWFNDVQYTGTYSCEVTLRHPTEAKTGLIGEDKTRKQYLYERGLLPRTEGVGKYKAGWKTLKTDASHQAKVFFMHESVEATFRQFHESYIKNYRTALMKSRRKEGLPDHPFLFVSNGFDGASNKSFHGAPTSISSFDAKFTKALNRLEVYIGEKIPRGKKYGTTPHGARHFYAQTLVDVGLQKTEIKELMRHRSIFSQGAYTSPTFKKIQAQLGEAKKKISNQIYIGEK